MIHATYRTELHVFLASLDARGQQVVLDAISALDARFALQRGDNEAAVRAAWFGDEPCFPDGEHLFAIHCAIMSDVHLVREHKERWDTILFMPIDKVIVSFRSIDFPKLGIYTPYDLIEEYMLDALKDVLERTGVVRRIELLARFVEHAKSVQRYHPHRG